MTTEDIVREFETGLRAFVRARVDNRADADDVLQDVLLKLHRASDGVRDEERVAGWVFSVARNAVTDYYRTKTPEVLPGPELSENFDETAAAELALCVRPFVEILDEPYREAVTLVDLQGLTHAEAAERAGVSVSGMKSRVQRGRAKLRGEIEECCYVELDARGAVTDYEPRRCSSC